MTTTQITHPPLSDAEFKRIAASHTSPDAVLLLREIERLKVIEHRVAQLAEMARRSNYRYGVAVADIVERAVEGRLDGTRRFGIPLPIKPCAPTD